MARPKLPGRSQEMQGNRHPQMNDRLPPPLDENRVRRSQNSAYGMLRPLTFIKFVVFFELKSKCRRTIRFLSPYPDDPAFSPSRK